MLKANNDTTNTQVLRLVENIYLVCTSYLLSSVSLLLSIDNFNVSVGTSVNRNSLSQMLFKIGILKNYAIFIGKHLCWSLFLLKRLFQKETPTKVFSCEYCKIFKNTFFTENLRKTPSKLIR